MATFLSTYRPSNNYVAPSYFYILNKEILDTVYTKFVTDHLFESAEETFTERLQFVSSLRIYPFSFLDYEDMPHLSSSDLELGEIFLGITTGTATDIYPDAYQFVGQSNLNGIGKSIVLIDEIFSTIGRDLDFEFDFLKYSPYTKWTFYLPYYGFLELSASEIYSKTIRIVLELDVSTGVGTYFIGRLDNKKYTLIKTVECQLGFDIPIGGNNQAKANQQAFSGVLSTIFGAGALGVALAAETGGGSLALTGTAMLASGFKDMYMSQFQDVIQKGNFTGNANNLDSPSSIYVIIEKVVPNLNSVNPSLMGRPLQKTLILSSLSGFTKVADFHPTGFTSCMDTEVNLISGLLKQGVII